MPRLSDEQVQQALHQLPDWQYDKSGRRISRYVNLATYMDGIRLVNKLAEIAEAHQHHPDLEVGYRKVGIHLITHDSGGVTDKDIAMAKRVDDLLP